MVWFFAGVVLGWLIEWWAHKYLLHNFSRRLFSYAHFSIHHRNCRKNGFYDADYEVFPPKEMDRGLMEVILIVSAIVAAMPIMLLSFWLWLGVSCHAVFYYFIHRKSHLDVEWGKKWLPWHYQHHMGKDQNANWGVTNPVFDHIFRTRKK